MKAKLTGRQVVAAIFAGIIGHFFFAAGWVGLGLILLGGVIIALLGGSAASFGGLLGDPEVLKNILGGVGGVAGGLVIGLAIGAVVLMFLGFLFSGLILRGGKVRKPWGTTWTAILIAAILSLPLLLVYGAIAGNTADGQPRFTIVLLIGTAVVGILVWLWMTWAHRGSASEFAGVSESSSSASVTEAAYEVESAPAAFATTAPVKKTPPAN